MYFNNLLEKFCKDRNIKLNTQKGYESALKCYENFQKDSIENLFAEARAEEN